MKLVHALIWLIFLLCGCIHSKETKESTTSIITHNDAVHNIKYLIIKHLGEHVEKVMRTEGLVCFLYLTDSDYAWVKNQLCRESVTFKFDTAKNAITKNEQPVHVLSGERGVILTVYIESVNEKQATADGCYHSGGHFTEYQFKLIYDGGNWKIVDVKFTWAT